MISVLICVCFLAMFVYSDPSDSSNVLAFCFPLLSAPPCSCRQLSSAGYHGNISKLHKPLQDNCFSLILIIFILFLKGLLNPHVTVVILSRVCYEFRELSSRPTGRGCLSVITCHHIFCPPPV